jgi:segregation and condensation protein B
MTADHYKSAAFAVLFAVGEPVPASRIAQALGDPELDVEGILASLSEELDAADAGVCLLRFEDRYQLATRPKYSDYVVKALDNRRTTPLSQAAMETLAIVAYNQPCSRAFIDEIRGVDSSSSLNTLIGKNLVAEGGRLDLPGRPLSFVTTDNFLRCFGLKSLDELPTVHGEGADLFAPEEKEEEP